MILMWKGERIINGMVRAWRRDELSRQLMELGPATAYSVLLGYAQRHSKKPHRYTWYLFQELFGVTPKLKEQGEPAELEGFVVEEWVMLRPKKKLPPRKLKIADQPPPQSDLMSAADWEVKW